DLSELELAKFDVIALCNVRALSPAEVDGLEAWTRAGGGLLLTMGDHVDPDRWNTAMATLLPQRLATVIDLDTARSGDQAGQALRLDKLELEHPLFTPFADGAAALAGARFRKVMLL